MVQLSVMTFMFEKFWKSGEITHEKMIEQFKKLGITGVEPFHTFFTAEPELIKRYKKATGDNGMKVSAVDVLCDLVYGTEQERISGLDELKRGLDICAELGAEVAHVAGHMPKPGVSKADGHRMIADGLLSQKDFAESHGITLAVEDFGFTPSFLCMARDMKALLDMAEGGIKLVFDTGNFEFAGEQADKNFDILYPYACYIHFKDWMRTDNPEEELVQGSRLTGSPLGEGIVPNKEIASLLTERKYSGWAALEATQVGESPESTVKRDIGRLKSWLGL